MTLPTYRPWMNIVIYQGIWFLAVLGRETWQPWLLLPLALHLLLCRDRGRELAVILACSTVGVLVDSSLALAGVYEFRPPAELLPIPLWLVAIWLGFTATLRHALSWFVARAPLFLAAGVVGAPLSYIAAARLGAVNLPLGYLTSGLIIAAVWIPIMLVQIGITRRLMSPAASGDRADRTA